MSVVDTNLLVHATSASSVDNKRARTALIRLAADSRIAIPRQVIREYLSVMTGRGFEGQPITMASALDTILGFTSRFTILDDGPRVWTVFESLARSVAFGGKQVHDANIVATMLAHGETRILTFNVKDFRRFEPLIEIIEP